MSFSLIDPYAHVTGDAGTGVRIGALRHFVYASSSSVYGANSKRASAKTDFVEHPSSLYAAVKRADELMSHTYTHLYGIAATGLRFFTVYGPWGRPDVAPILFARTIAAGEPIRVFNHGEMWRDFTYIDDIVNGVVRALIVSQPARRRTRFTILATTGRKSLQTSSPPSKAPSSARRRW